MLERTARALIGSAAGTIDRMATRAAYAKMRRARKRSRVESLPHAERMVVLRELAQRYESGDDFYREPRSVSFETTPVRRLFDGGRVLDVRWSSDYEPFLAEVTPRYCRCVDNGRAAARLWLHPEPRAAAVLVHGYMGGNHAVEERAWPASWFYRSGLDLAFFVLPFHGLRGIPQRRHPPPFPGSDPRMSNEGFRQAIGDLRDIVHWLRAGGREVGVMGMSLGGYTAALAATVERELSFAFPLIPLSSLADFAREQHRLGHTPEEEELQYGALDAVHRVISPLHRPLVIPSERVLIVGAEADRITPLRHARRLADHFGSDLDTWPGGHLLQLGRGEAFRRIAKRLGDLELLHPVSG